MVKLIYVDNLRFLNSKDKLKVYSNFGVDELFKLNQSSLEDFLGKKFKKTLRFPDLKLVELQEKILNRVGVKFTFISRFDYPLKLKRLYDPPFALYYKGNFPESSERIWAVVGSRKVSKNIASISREYSSHLAKNNVSILSGFAVGVDIEAHLGAISEKQKTYAVIATDIDNIYPKQNRKYVSKLLEYGGGIITETLPYEKIQNYYFAKRNRIVAGLSDVVFVIYAPLKSGALITVDIGLDLGLDIYVHDTVYSGEGAKNLAESGATEIKNIKDIYNILNIEYENLNNANTLDNENNFTNENISDMLIQELFRGIKGK